MQLDFLGLWDLLLGDGGKRGGDRPAKAAGKRREKSKEPAWDKPAHARPAPKTPSPAKLAPAKPAETKPARAEAGGMAARYERVTREMLARYGVRVRRWRTSMSGVASLITYKDGRVSRWIEAPRPRGPMSAAVFLHEIGHHALGVGSIKPRCLEEYMAWKFALDTMEAEGLNVTDAVRRRMQRSLKYAVGKARRRGLKRLPAELLPYA